MAITNDTRQMLDTARSLREMVQQERPDNDFLNSMVNHLVKSTERLLAREITPPLVIRREEIKGH